MRGRTGSAIVGGLALGAALVGLLQADDAAQGPRALAVWAAGPLETRIAFDRAVDPSVTSQTVGKTIVLDDTSPTADPSRLKPRDRDPAAEHTGTLKIAAARLEDDGRTLVLSTDPHARVATYTLDVGGLKGRGDSGAGKPIHLAYDLTGASAAWDDGREEAKPERL